MTRATSSDVAALAKVSRSTVSFVLNDVLGQTIPEPTRKRVIAAAKQLNYVPSAAGRVLRQGRSNLVVFILPDLVPSERLDFALATWSERLAQHDLVTVSIRLDNRRTLLPELWKSLTPAAVVALFTLSRSERKQIEALGAPLMEALYYPEHGQPARSQLQYEVGRVQARCLLEAGHRVIAYLDTGDPRDSGLAGARFEGLQQEATKSDATVTRMPLPLTPRGSAEALHVLMTTTPRPTAVACYNDLVAIAALSAATANELVVPRDLAVIGADNSTVSQFVTPALTTIELASEEDMDWIVQGILSAMGAAASDVTAPDPTVEIVRRASV